MIEGINIVIIPFYRLYVLFLIKTDFILTSIKMDPNLGWLLIESIDNDKIRNSNTILRRDKHFAVSSPGHMIYNYPTTNSSATMSDTF